MANPTAYRGSPRAGASLQGLPKPGLVALRIRPAIRAPLCPPNPAHRIGPTPGNQRVELVYAAHSKGPPLIDSLALWRWRRGFQDAEVHQTVVSHSGRFLRRRPDSRQQPERATRQLLLISTTSAASEIHHCSPHPPPAPNCTPSHHCHPPSPTRPRENLGPHRRPLSKSRPERVAP